MSFERLTQLPQRLFSHSASKTLKENIFDTFNYFYERSPITGASITGWHHLSMPRKAGTLLGGSIAQVAKDVRGYGEYIGDMGEKAKTSKTGRVQSSFAIKPNILLTTPSDVVQVFIHNDENIDRGKTMPSFNFIFGHENLVSIPKSDLWEKKRKQLVDWMLTEEALTHLAKPIQQIVEERINELKKEGNVPSIEGFLVELTMDVIARTQMGAKSLGAESKGISHTLGIALDVSTAPLNNISAELVASKLGAILEYFHIINTTPLQKSKTNLETILTNHFLASDGSCCLRDTYLFKDYFVNRDNKTAFKLVLDDVKLLLLAGHETTARLIQFCLLLLERHPDVLKKLRAEIDAQKKPADHQWTREDLNKLTYLGQILKETLRLFPPFPVLPRTVTKEFVLADIPLCADGAAYREAMKNRDQTKDVILHPGDQLSISPLITQRRAYTDPLTFKPERHKIGAQSFGMKTKERKVDSDELGKLFPFGLGKRDCIGQGFAIEEAMQAIIKFTREYDFATSHTAAKENTATGIVPNLPETYIRGTLKYDGDDHMSFRPRC